MSDRGNQTAHRPRERAYDDRFMLPLVFFRGPDHVTIERSSVAGLLTVTFADPGATYRWRRDVRLEKYVARGTVPQ